MSSGNTIIETIRSSLRRIFALKEQTIVFSTAAGFRKDGEG